MGCVSSTERHSLGVPFTTAEWLESLRLGKYTDAFYAAGFDDLTTLSHLNKEDLEIISGASPCPILAGHRKQLLLEAPKLRSTWKLRRQRTSISPSVDASDGFVALPRVLGPLQVEVADTNRSEDGCADLAPGSVASASVPSTSPRHLTLQSRASFRSNGSVQSDHQVSQPVKGGKMGRTRPHTMARGFSNRPPRLALPLSRGRTPPISRSQTPRETPPTTSPSSPKRTRAAVHGTTPRRSQGSLKRCKGSHSPVHGTRTPAVAESVTPSLHRSDNPPPRPSSMSPEDGSHRSGDCSRESITLPTSISATATSMSVHDDDAQSSCSSFRRLSGATSSRHVPGRQAPWTPSPWTSSTTTARPDDVAASEAAHRNQGSRAPDEEQAKLATRAMRREEASQKLRSHLAMVRKADREVAAASSARQNAGKTRRPMGPPWIKEKTGDNERLLQAGRVTSEGKTAHLSVLHSSISVCATSCNVTAPSPPSVPAAAPITPFLATSLRGRFGSTNQDLQAAGAPGDTMSMENAVTVGAPRGLFSAANPNEGSAAASRRGDAAVSIHGASIRQLPSSSPSRKKTASYDRRTGSVQEAVLQGSPSPSRRSSCGVTTKRSSNQKMSFAEAKRQVGSKAKSGFVEIHTNARPLIAHPPASNDGPDVSEPPADSLPICIASNPGATSPPMTPTIAKPNFNPVSEVSPHFAAAVAFAVKPDLPRSSVFNSPSSSARGGRRPHSVNSAWSQLPRKPSMSPFKFRRARLPPKQLAEAGHATPAIVMSAPSTPCHDGRGVLHGTPEACPRPPGYSPVIASAVSPPQHFVGAPSLARATGLLSAASPSAAPRTPKLPTQNEQAREDAPERLPQQYSPMSPLRGLEAEEALRHAELSVRQRMAAHRSKTLPPQYSEQQQVQRRLFDGPGATGGGARGSPGLQPPIISPMQRGGHRPVTLQPDLMAAISNHGSPLDTDALSPQLTLQGVEDRITRRVSTEA